MISKNLILKDKILVWMPREFHYFGIAKFLADNHDCEIYGITDAWDKEKFVLENQKFLNFKKIFYYRDQVIIDKNKKPDLEYLKSFEEKYGINIWQLTYMERIFYKFNPYYDYKKNEILSILEQECIFFEKIIKEVNPNFLLISITDSHTSHLLAKITQKFDIPILSIGLARFRNKVLFYGDIDAMSSIMKPTKKPTKTFDPKFTLENYLEGKDLAKGVKDYQQRISPLKNMKQRIKRGFGFFQLLGHKDFRNHYHYYHLTRSKFLKTRISLKFKNKYIKYFVKKNLQNSWNEKETPFIFYPLHAEPERTVSISTPFFTNQVEIITNIAKSIPVKYRLFVKEHPFMEVAGGRSISFYKEIMKLPNVKLLHHNTNQKKLLRSCSLVITLSGTTALEGAFYGKPAITFGNTLFSNLSFIKKIKELEEIPEAIKSSLQKKVDTNELLEFLKFLDINSFDCNLHSVVASFGNYFRNVNLNELDLKNVLNENRLELEKISLAHINKIKEIKNMTFNKTNSG